MKTDSSPTPPIPAPVAIPPIHGNTPASSKPGGFALRGLLIVLLALGNSTPAHAAGQDITPKRILLGGVMDLKGRSKGLGLGMSSGIQAALEGQKIGPRQIQYEVRNDSYNPKKTIEATRRLIERGVFLFAGNVGTPTAKVSLPILKKQGIPAVGFFTGAGLLRTPEATNVINYRASYSQEIAAVIDSALKHGLQADEICAYVQNDAYGMAGIQGLIDALRQREDSAGIVAKLEALRKLPGDNPPRNGIGPVGVYQRNTYLARPGYESLKQWEKANDTQCRLVVTVGSYTSVAKFIGYARYKHENWLFSAVSFTGAENFRSALKEMNTENQVIMTQVVPHLDSKLEIVQQARKALGEHFNSVSLEGYIVGKLILHGLRNIDGEPTRRAFLDALLGKSFQLGGLKMDFTDDNQGSDLVTLTLLKNGEWRPMRERDWAAIR